MPGFLDWLANTFGDGTPAPPLATPGLPPSPTPTGLAADDSRLPDASRPRVAKLLELIEQIEERAARDPLLTSALTEVRQMRDSHLPQVVTSYADIPPAHRAEIFRRTGKSASFTLNEGLDKMIARAEALSKSMAQENIDSFADSLRFIDTRYGNKDPLG